MQYILLFTIVAVLASCPAFSQTKDYAKRSLDKEVVVEKNGTARTERSTRGSGPRVVRRQ